MLESSFVALCDICYGQKTILCVKISAQSIRRLQLIQNTSARPITDTKKVEHITAVFKSLKWLLMFHIIDFKTLLLVYEGEPLNGLRPKYISDLVRFYEIQTSHFIWDKGLLSVPATTHYLEEASFL